MMWFILQLSLILQMFMIESAPKRKFVIIETLTNKTHVDETNIKTTEKKQLKTTKGDDYTSEKNCYPSFSGCSFWSHTATGYEKYQTQNNAKLNQYWIDSCTCKILKYNPDTKCAKSRCRFNLAGPIGSTYRKQHIITNVPITFPYPHQTANTTMAKEGPCSLDEDIDYPGMDLNLATGSTSDKKKSALECRALCNETPLCNFFTWKADSNECWIKNGISRKENQIGATSGSACIEGPCSLDEDIDYPGMDLNLATGSNSDKKKSALECRALCNETPLCKFFTWKADTKECWIKNGISRKENQIGATSGSACIEGCSKRFTCVHFTKCPAIKKEIHESVKINRKRVCNEKGEKVCCEK